VVNLTAGAHRTQQNAWDGFVVTARQGAAEGDSDRVGGRDELSVQRGRLGGIVSSVQHATGRVDGSSSGDVGDCGMGVGSHGLVLPERGLRSGRMRKVEASRSAVFMLTPITMAKSIRVYTKSNRADQAGTMVGVRLQPAPLADLDAWREKQPDLPSRPEAIRQLLKLALNMEDN
jgi:hypothetical protein